MPDPLDSFLRYNVQTNVWQTLSPMKHPTSYPHLLLYKTHIYAIETDNNTMQRYNIIHNYCQQLTNPPLALSNSYHLQQQQQQQHYPTWHMHYSNPL